LTKNRALSPPKHVMGGFVAQHYRKKRFIIRRIHDLQLEDVE